MLKPKVKGQVKVKGKVKVKVKVKGSLDVGPDRPPSPPLAEAAESGVYDV